MTTPEKVSARAQATASAVLVRDGIGVKILG
jgi:hypothetical protein